MFLVASCFCKAFLRKEIAKQGEKYGRRGKIWVESASCNFFKVSYPFEVSRSLR